MKATKSLESGLAGAFALTLVHEVLRNSNRLAPRMDLLGMNALKKILTKSGTPVPSRKTLFLLTMAGDIISNALYYSLSGVGNKKGALLRGTSLGLAAGIGAVVLPKHIGLSNKPSDRTSATKIMTVGLYLFGGLVAASVLSLTQKASK